MRRLLGYGLLNAAAYCCLLPLWEGWDEPYHYGYAQFLSTNFRFPELGRTVLSREVWHSMQLTPVSPYWKQLGRGEVSFSDYFALSPGERAEMRRRLESLPAAEKFEPQTDRGNYESSQPPGAYLLMAIADRALFALPITTRVLWVRLVSAFLSVGLIVHSMLLLARELRVGPEWTAVALFCTLSSQMLWATVCHVANDWLAVPLMMYILWAAIARRWSLFGAIFGLALLTKAYFLFVLPIALVFWRSVAAFGGPLLLLAGPWYLRNLVLYRNLSGAVEQMSGITLWNAFPAAMAVPWLRSIPYMARASLWTGNNSFVTFSARTLNIVLAVIAAGIVLFFMRAAKRTGDWIVIAAVGSFCCGLAVITVTFYAGTGGKAFAAQPWYMQPLLGPMLLLVCRGFASIRRGWLGGLLLMGLFAYMLVLTYFVKLLPMYSGAFLAPAPLVYALCGAASLSALAITVRLAQPLWSYRHAAERPPQTHPPRP